MHVALLQMTSSLDVAGNAQTVKNAIAQAARNGASFISTPEMTNFLAKSRQQSFDRAVPEADDVVLKTAIDAAKHHSVWVHLGSICVRLSDDTLANRTILIGPDGAIHARYDKIHMFDVELGGDESYRESALYRPGDRAVTAQVGSAKLGLSICYDLRFGGLYRALARAGADILCIPAAFTQPTGEAHWETLLRARAIENGCFVLAAGQTGHHESGRKTHGHSMMIDPWGRVLKSLERQTGLLYSELALSLVQDARSKISSLDHDRSFEVCESTA